MVIINTRTFENYMEVIEWAIDRGMRWRDPCDYDSYRAYWYEHNEDMCVIINKNILTYAEVEFNLTHYNIEIFDMDQFYEYAGDIRFGDKFNLK